MATFQVNPHSVILFQGDSITDASRSRLSRAANDPQGMGFGYPRLVMDQLLERYPDRDLQFYNRGVSGDRLQDMASRWPDDTLRMNPDLVSILIGVNDTWNYLYMGLGSSPAGFRSIYHRLLTHTRERLPGVALALCEPFVLFTGEVTEEWEEDISSRQRCVQELAGEFNAVFVPFQSALDSAVAEGVRPQQLLDDGVHPTQWGHSLLAACWMENVLKD